MRHIRGASSRAGGICPDLELHSSGERRLHAQEIESRNGGTGGGGGGGARGAGGEGERGAGNGASDGTGAGAATATETPRSAQTIHLVTKSREIHHRFQSSVFYVRSAKELPDVVRYGDRLRPPPNIDASAVLSHCLGGKKRTRGEGGGVFVPEELCGGQRLGGTGAAPDEESRNDNKAKRGLNLVALARKIRSEGGMDAAAGDGSGDEDDAAGGELGLEQDGEESDGADYAQNYYESEGEESGGSDGEPTF